MVYEQIGLAESNCDLVAAQDLRLQLRRTGQWTWLYTTRSGSRHDLGRRHHRTSTAVTATIGALAVLASTPVKSAPDAPVVLSIDGTVAPLRLTAEAIAAMPRTGVTCMVHDKQMVREGPWLTDVLAQAGVPSGEAVRGKLLSTIVVATGRDSYNAVFTGGELDHMLGPAMRVAATCRSAHRLT